jgi:catechol 2,3-dioxygenase-like lactoylglutathione lyase family enzyme
MGLRSLDHYNIETTELGSTIAFYRDGLGMTLGNRPEAPMPGVWLCVDDYPVVHVNVVPVAPAGDTGAVGHVAFEAADFGDVCERLECAGIPYEVVDSRPALPLRQIYVRDPNDIRIELNVRDGGGRPTDA